MIRVWLLAALPLFTTDLERAQTLYRQRDFAAAESQLRGMLSAKPGDSAARLLLARTLVNLGRVPEAMEMLDLTLASDPSPEVKFQIGQIAREMAELRFAALQDAAPQSAALREIMGRQRELNGRFAEALEEYRAAAALQPDRPGIHYWAGNALWNLRRLEEAKAELQRELQITPHHVMANMRLGQVLIAMNEDAAAVGPLEFAVRALPDSMEARKALGKAYLKAGRTQDARREWETVADRAPSDDQVHYLLGNLYRELGERALAQSAFARHREILERRRTLAERK